MLGMFEQGQLWRDLSISFTFFAITWGSNRNCCGSGDVILKDDFGKWNSNAEYFCQDNKKIQFDGCEENPLLIDLAETTETFHGGENFFV